MSTKSIVILENVGRTASTNSADFDLNHEGRGRFIIDATTIPATTSVVFAVQTLDKASGKYVTILQTASITAVGTTLLEIGQGVTATANAAADRMLPDVFRVTATHSAAGTYNYSVGLEYVD